MQKDVAHTHLLSPPPPAFSALVRYHSLWPVSDTLTLLIICSDSARTHLAKLACGTRCCCISAASAITACVYVMIDCASSKTMLHKADMSNVMLHVFFPIVVSNGWMTARVTRITAMQIVQWFTCPTHSPSAAPMTCQTAVQHYFTVLFSITVLYCTVLFSITCTQIFYCVL